jgi:hypothetical protein
MPIIGFGGGGFGGGSSYINGVVENSTNLPVTVTVPPNPPLDSIYLVKSDYAVGTSNYKPAGLYIRVANNGNVNDWSYLGAFPEINSDSNWEVYNNTDPTKKVKLDVSGVTSGSTTTLSIPDRDGTVFLVDDPIQHIVYNNSGTAISKGKAVYLYGSQGQRTTIRLADNSSELTSDRTFGLTAETIADNASGFVVTEGVLHNVNTSGFPDGTLLWLGTNGAFQATRPTQPLHGVFLGVVVKGNSSGGGSIFVKTQNGQELDELHDVLISNPATGQALARNTTNTLWVNRALTSEEVGALKAERTGQLVNVTAGLGNDIFYIPSGRNKSYSFNIDWQSFSLYLRLPNSSCINGDRIVINIPYVPYNPDRSIYIQDWRFIGTSGPPIWQWWTIFSVTGTTNNGGYVQKQLVLEYQDGQWNFAVSVNNIAELSLNGRQFLNLETIDQQRIHISPFGFVSNQASLPISGTSRIQKLYLSTDTSKAYLFNGATFVEISPNRHTRSGTNNTFVNDSALASASLTGTENTAIGSSALSVNTSGAENTAIGSSALSANTSGAGNTAVGFAAGNTLTTGGNNTLVGDTASVDAVGRNNCIVLGAGAVSGNADGTISIGGTGGTAMGNLTTLSAPTGTAKYLRVWLNGVEHRILATEA